MRAQSLSILDVPFLSQSESLCGGAAAAMTLRYWGERGLTAESFSHLVDGTAAGIRTDALVAELRRRGWNAAGLQGDRPLAARELARGRPVVALIEDRPGVYHYVVIVAWPERGVVFHDPARAPFRIMSTTEFLRRWEEAGRWMLVLVPGADVVASAGRSDAGPSAPGLTPASGCDGLLNEGVRAAQAGDLAGAERPLIEALGCDGGAALRELAGVRLLQERWPDVALLASAALDEDPTDAYAWKLLGTSRYVQGEASGALDAWNHIGEPRVDLVRIDSLTRTRHRVVEHAIGVEAETVLTSSSLARARRRLWELPSSTQARLEFVPAPSGRVEIRGAVSERSVFPKGPLTWAAIGLVTASTRELRISSGSWTGGGEGSAVAWRFRPHRPRVAANVGAPAPWRGVWGIGFAAERQEFDRPGVAAAERVSATATMADWFTGTLRWEARTGFDRWKDDADFGTVGGSLRYTSPGDRATAAATAGVWLGNRRFTTGELAIELRSSTERLRTVVVASAMVQAAGQGTPIDLWFGGDSGTTRAATLRAHPVLDDGRLRLDRIGRRYGGVSVEGQRWWPQRGRLQTGLAAFLDAGLTDKRSDAGPRSDVDVGIGARFALVGLPGVFRADLAKGLRDGSTWASFVYSP